MPNNDQGGTGLTAAPILLHCQSSESVATVGVCVALTSDNNTGENAAPQADQPIVKYKGHGVPQHLCSHSMSSKLLQLAGCYCLRYEQCTACDASHRCTARTTPKPQNPADQKLCNVSSAADFHAHDEPRCQHFCRHRARRWQKQQRAGVPMRLKAMRYVCRPIPLRTPPMQPRMPSGNWYSAAMGQIAATMRTTSTSSTKR
jgi:hypothetical protein